MKDHNKEFCIEKMARVLKVSRAGYYKFLRITPSKRKLENEELIKKIRKAYEEISQALKQALCHRNVKGGLMHHCDRGSQYTSKEFEEITKEHGIILSMSGKGHCYDNAVAESFFHTLKTEHDIVTFLCRIRTHAL